MKVSKLFKFKGAWLKEAGFYLMYVFGSLSIGYNAGMNDWAHCLTSVAFVLTAYGWRRTYLGLTKVLSACDCICNTNDELIVMNKELSDKYKQELSIAQGLISENKDLKLKLKNARMENSRIRKGGSRHE